jgi:hypothetical protein
LLPLVKVALIIGEGISVIKKIAIIARNIKLAGMIFFSYLTDFSYFPLKNKSCRT